MALTKFNFNSFDVTSAASKGLGFNASANGFSTIDPGAMTLIKTLTASSSSTLSFVDGSSSVVLDNTYSVYMFKFINMHPATSDASLTFNMSVDGGSNYNVTKTTTTPRAYHDEADSEAAIEYDTGQDLAQSTSFQGISRFLGNGNDECGSGTLHIFDPSSTTFVKHFKSRISNAENQSAIDTFVAGYGNTTSAVDAVCVCNKVILPCANCPELVIADIELLLCFTKPKVIRLLHIILLFLNLYYLNPF